MILDLVVLGILLVSAIVAFFRGFIRELLTIMGVVGGAVAALSLGPALSPLMLRWISTPPEPGKEAEKIFGLIPPDQMAAILAYGAIFIVVVIILSVVSHFLSGWAKAIGLGAVDRTFGVFFGLARGALLIALLYLPLLLVMEKDTRDDWFKGSKTHHYVEAGASWLSGFIPEGATDDMKKKASDVSKQKAEEVRERLRDMEMLQPDMPAYNSAAPQGNGTDNGEGYGQEQRRDMNELIMDNVND
jgi:membrane protein required for colicin V production